MLVERYRPDEKNLLIFFSGAKGFHVALLTSLWLPEPSVDFHELASLYAGELARLTNVTIDASIYSKTRLFRSPNSKHAKTGLHKRRLSLDELMGLSVQGILELSREPLAFEPPEPTATNDRAIADWRATQDQLQKHREERAERGTTRGATLNQLTLEIIRDCRALGSPTEIGNRHRLLYSAAKNFGELGASFELAFALLRESGLDSGLMPADVERQIQCGVSDGRPKL
ncbi:MAG TPA: hypothetical protein VHC22_16355 [Pirellulales bacterium]|nr:hypothetical protein [Pirellulales bacterium]